MFYLYFKKYFKLVKKNTDQHFFLIRLIEIDFFIILSAAFWSIWAYSVPLFWPTQYNYWPTQYNYWPTQHHYCPTQHHYCPTQHHYWPTQYHYWPSQYHCWPSQYHYWPSQYHYWPSQYHYWPIGTTIGLSVPLLAY